MGTALHEAGVIHAPIPVEWKYRMTQRIKIASLVGNVGDNVLMLDTDLYFKCDPFQLFKNDFDLVYTSRPIDNHLSPVNGGVWGFRQNSRSSMLLQEMYKQAINPNWPEYNEIRRRLNRIDRIKELDWWTNQDLLCAIHESGPPVPSKTFNAGPNFNWCPDSGPGRPLTDTAISRFYSGYKDPNVKIMHYKELKH